MSKMEKFIKNYTYGFTFPFICISIYNANGNLLRKKMFNRFQDAAGNSGYFCHECRSYDEITNYLKRKILDDMHDGAMVMSPIAESHDSIDDLDNSKNPDIVIFSWNQYERDWILNQVDEKERIGIVMESIIEDRIHGMFAYDYLKERILESKVSLETVNACWSYLDKVGKLTDDAADNCEALRNLAISDLNRYNASLANWDKTHPYLKSWWESEHMIMKNSNCDALNSSFIG